MDSFHPRSFNMGYRKEVFTTTGGFSKMRFGEDIDMSMRILAAGFTTKLIKGAFVFHKRRSTLRQFFKQVYNSGIARINLNKRHPGSLKFVHAIPAFFTLGVIGLVLLTIALSAYFVLPILLHMLILFIDASAGTRSLRIGALAVLTSYVQLFGYGLGFLGAFWKRVVLKQDEYAAFNKNFYK